LNFHPAFSREKVPEILIKVKYYAIASGLVVRYSLAAIFP